MSTLFITQLQALIMKQSNVQPSSIWNHSLFRKNPLDSFVTTLSHFRFFKTRMLTAHWRNFPLSVLINTCQYFCMDPSFHGCFATGFLVSYRCLIYNALLQLVLGGKNIISYLHLSSYIFSGSNRNLTITILCLCQFGLKLVKCQRSFSREMKNVREKAYRHLVTSEIRLKNRTEVCLQQYCMKQPSQQQDLETIVLFKAMNNNYSCCQKNMTILNV